MAAVTKGTLRNVTPAGQEANEKGQAKVAIAAGDLLVATADTPGMGYDTVWTKAPTSTVDAQGIALMAAAAGGTVNVGIQGEMDGFTGLTAPNPLYPSASVAGGIDTTAPTGAVARIRARNATKIYFNFV